MLFFLKSGLLEMLESDYEDLHGMGMEALMQFFDEYLHLSSQEVSMIEHNSVRSVVTPEIIRLICKYYGIDENEALHRFYLSNTAANYADEETGLYGQSALYLVSHFIIEQDGDIDLARLQ